MNSKLEPEQDIVVFPPKNGKEKVYKWDIAWVNATILFLLHIGAVYGLYLRPYTLWSTAIVSKIFGVFSTLGITGGAHRLWAHRSYKANNIVQIVLMFLATCTYENSIYVWARDHRVHHRYSETDADPHNAKRGSNYFDDKIQLPPYIVHLKVNRLLQYIPRVSELYGKGFFFCHVGWLLVRKHPDVIKKGKTIDMSDLEANPIVMFQRKYYYPLVFLGTIALPMCICHYGFGESWKISFFVPVVYRYILSTNLVWCINSLAHLYGNKPYNKRIGPTENLLMRCIGLGEGFHNYHHTFPWDYKAGEFNGDAKNLTATMIDTFAKYGWVTDRKTVPHESVHNFKNTYGDGTTIKKPNFFIRIKDTILLLLFVSIF